jgi:Uma2 family endonuclease
VNKLHSIMLLELMTATKHSSVVSLEEFLQLPETKPASEYIDDRIIQKTMPKARHSRLQAKLTSTINEVTESQRIAYAFPELRCTFGNRSTVPDIAVLLWGKIEFDVNGEPVDNVVVAPDWTIEILSPDQSANRVTGNILHCLSHGCQLGWLVDPEDRSILVFRSQQQPELLTGENVLPALTEIGLTLTVEQVFSWLQMGG